MVTQINLLSRRPIRFRAELVDHPTLRQPINSTDRWLDIVRIKPKR